MPTSEQIVRWRAQSADSPDRAMEIEKFWSTWERNVQSLSQSVTMHLSQQGQLVAKVLQQHQASRQPDSHLARYQNHGRSSASRSFSSIDIDCISGTAMSGVESKSVDASEGHDATRTSDHLQAVKQPTSATVLPERQPQGQSQSQVQGRGSFASSIGGTAYGPSVCQTTSPMASTASRAPMTSVHSGVQSSASASTTWTDNYKKLKEKEHKRRKLSWLDDKVVREATAAVPRERTWVQTFLVILHWWNTLEEPPRSGLLYHLIRHRVFDLYVAVVIIANSIFTVYQFNHQMDVLGPEITTVDALEWIFLSCYIIELSLKLWVHKVYFFCNQEMGWNIFDLFLVCFGVMDLMLTVFGNSFGNVTFARSLRLFKIGKILRIFKTMRFLKELRVMVGSICGSFISLFWSFVMIGMIVYVFALIFVQQMAATLAESDQDTGLWQNQRYYFRSVERGMLTLIESTMGGLDWDMVYRCIAPLGIFYTMAFIFYIAFFTFAVMNILTGIFLDNAMKLCKPDEDELDQERRQKMMMDMREISLIGQAMDINGNGYLSKEEFLIAAEDEELVSRFAALGIDIRNISQFVDTVGGLGSGQEIQVQDFVAKAASLQGMASSTTLQYVSTQVGELQAAVIELAKLVPLPAPPATCPPKMVSAAPAALPPLGTRLSL